MLDITPKYTDPQQKVLQNSFLQTSCFHFIVQSFISGNFILQQVLTSKSIFQKYSITNLPHTGCYFDLPALKSAKRISTVYVSLEIFKK